MKILVIPSWYPPNGGRFFKLQAESLAKLGHQVDVLILEEIGFSKKRNVKIESGKSNLVNEIRNKFYRIPKMDNLNIELFIRKYKKLLANYLVKQKPAIIHVHSSIWAGVVVAELANKYQIPIVITEHRSLFLKEKLPFNSKLINRVKFALDNSCKLLVVSDAMKQKLSVYTKNAIEVLPNMVDTDFFQPQKNKKKDSKIVFVSVGNLDPVKGFDILIYAFAKIVKENKNVELNIIGEGKELTKLKALTEQLNITTQLNFVGYKTRDELLTIYQNASVFVSSSRVETFGVSIIEAMSCGLPIVVTDSGGPADIVNQENGYLAEKENVDSLFSKMQLMIDNLSNFDATTIRDSVISNYSEEKISKKLEKQFNQCLKNKKP